MVLKSLLKLSRVGIGVKSSLKGPAIGHIIKPLLDKTLERFPLRFAFAPQVRGLSWKGRNFGSSINQDTRGMTFRFAISFQRRFELELCAGPITRPVRSGVLT